MARKQSTQPTPWLRTCMRNVTVKATSTYYWKQSLIIDRHKMRYKMETIRSSGMVGNIRSELPKVGSYASNGGTVLPPENVSRN